MKNRSGFRKLTLDSGVWQYKVGESTVVMFSPEGKSHFNNSDLFEKMSIDEINEALSKQLKRPVKLRPSVHAVCASFGKYAYSVVDCFYLEDCK